MAKKSGLGALIAGVALGAAALFLSKKENRIKATKAVKTAVTKAKKLEAEYKKNPAKVTAAVKKKVAVQSKKIAKKAVAVAKKKVRKLTR
jgi:hypothetical protein